MLGWLLIEPRNSNFFELDTHRPLYWGMKYFTTTYTSVSTLENNPTSLSIVKKFDGRTLLILSRRPSKPNRSVNRAKTRMCLSGEQKNRNIYTQTCVSCQPTDGACILCWKMQWARARTAEFAGAASSCCRACRSRFKTCRGFYKTYISFGYQFPSVSIKQLKAHLV